MPISACYIVKNEQENLPRSINSLSAAVSEIIVVDTGSGDATVKTAESLGARVEYFEWVGDFSAARNFAISKTSNEIVIFPDADEWFVPELKKDDGEAIEKIFGSDPGLDSIMIPNHNVDSRGVITNANACIRILRKRDGLSYTGRIHEYYARDDGMPLKSIVSQDLKLLHSGYAEDIMADKMRRNIELLEGAVSCSQSAEERHLARCYLVREYLQAGNTGDSVLHLKAVLAEPDMIRKQCISLGAGFAALTYNMLQTAAASRGAVSRAELRRKLVEPFKRYIPKYPGAATIDLFFSCLFGVRDDILLKDIGPALDLAGKLPPSPTSFYLDVESLVSRFAAKSLMRRGKAAGAMEYALSSLKKTEDINPAGLRILLSCLLGQPSEEVVLFLGSQFDASDPRTLAILCEGTYIYGLKTVYAYYLNKKIEASMSTADEYLSLFLMLGNYSGGVSAALELLADKGEAAKALVSEKIFLAAICSGDEAVYRDNAGLLSAYTHILDAFFTGTAIAEPSDADAGILIPLLEHMAFSAGIERAGAVLCMLGDGYALPVFRGIAAFCVENCLYEHLLSMPRPAVQDKMSTRYIIECLVLSGRYDEAFDLISGLLAEGLADEALLQNLSAVADCASPAVKSRAGALYAEYVRLLDRYVDLTDIVNTGYIFDDSDRKRARALRSLTSAQFKKQLDADAASPPMSGLTELNETAGGIFERQGYPANAVDCYCYALAKSGAGENRESLLRVFKAIGNSQIKI